MCLRDSHLGPAGHPASVSPMRGRPQPHGGVGDRCTSTLKINHRGSAHEGHCGHGQQEPRQDQFLGNSGSPRYLHSLGSGALQSCPSTYDSSFFMPWVSPRHPLPQQAFPDPPSLGHCRSLGSQRCPRSPPRQGFHAGSFLPERGPWEDEDHGCLPIRHPQPHTRPGTEQALKQCWDRWINPMEMIKAVPQSTACNNEKQKPPKCPAIGVWLSKVKGRLLRP